jgi:transcription elongation factor Elf1
MEKMYYCPACSNPLLKITTVEDGEDIDSYICDICDISYTEEELNPSKKKTKKITR